MSPERPRQSSAYTQTIKRILLGNACLFAVGLALAVGSSAAIAKTSNHHSGRNETEHAAKDPFGNLPKGPLEIFVSINQQKLHFYIDGRHVADEPVATGVPGHLTPMGVFSVIQRDRYHHSNIYDNAPMPFMERITWSGVALHEGVGLGHQASHGCIRMPHDFAARLWTLHTMGMRVIIARPELKPTEFADSHLFVHKDKPIAALTLPHPVETAQTITPGTGTDAPAPAATAQAPAATPAPATPAVTAGAMPSSPMAPATTVAPTATTTAGAASSKASPSSLADIDKSAAAVVTVPAEPKPDVAATPAPAVPPVAAQATETTTPAPAAGAAPAQPAEAATAAPAATAAAPDTPATAPSASAPSPAPHAETAAIPPANLTAPVDATPPDVPLPPAKPARLAETGSGGPIAIFISRREHRIYVRQNMTPLFDAPVTIADPTQPLGTHVFTAMNYLADHSAFRWTVTSLPAEAQKMVHEARNNAQGRHHHERVEYVAAASTEPPETPEQALARIDIPQDVVEQISQLIVPGSSLVVSDQGLGPETGKGTDFIVIAH